ncbi:hypothetical protein BGX28_009899 [Mortierella sp. GBA30]|nr:hypothetical protein BGX28_009899 [Mortierella sp. GBA30]
MKLHRSLFKSLQRTLRAKACSRRPTQRQERDGENDRREHGAAQRVCKSVLEHDLCATQSVDRRPNIKGGKGWKKLKAGLEEKPAIGYTVHKTDIDQWMVEQIVKTGDAIPSSGRIRVYLFFNPV